MPQKYQLVFGCALALSAYAGDAYGEVLFEGVSWSFDQGGHIQQDPKLFETFQKTTTGSGPFTSHFSGMLGGSEFLSSVTITEDIRTTARGLSVLLSSTLHVSASVQSGWPEGLAQSYAAIDVLTASFTVTGDSYLYAGFGPLVDDGGTEYASGSVLPPGGYSYTEFDSAFVMTEVLGEGASESSTLERSLVFAFAAVPAPGSLVVILAPCLIPTGRRRRA